MNVKQIFGLNNIIKNGPGEENRFILPGKSNNSGSSRVGHGSFFIDDRHQILPVGGGSKLEAKRMTVSVGQAERTVF